MLRFNTPRAEGERPREPKHLQRTPPIRARADPCAPGIGFCRRLGMRDLGGGDDSADLLRKVVPAVAQLEGLNKYACAGARLAVFGDK